MLQFEKLEKKIYEKTCNLPYFTVNDIRELKLMKYFDSPHQLGWFFMNLSKSGHVTTTKTVKAEHEKARGRYVNAWKWKASYRKKFE